MSKVSLIFKVFLRQHVPLIDITSPAAVDLQETDPYEDNLTRTKAVKPLFGTVLDTATGLGYTAIAVAKVTSLVITVELDPVVLELRRYNPWSRELFENSKIEQRICDAYDEVVNFSDGYFSHIIHDPPVISLTCHLYSGDFYCELHRVLKPGGRLFHFIGDLRSKSGKSITKGVMN
ncbi:MAG TPA: hypothetical protein DEP47_04490 [Chloroflexi bacterium]|nr:hypothetical protein [Chloroflexota bacterium]